MLRKRVEEEEGRGRREEEGRRISIMKYTNMLLYEAFGFEGM
jgi:hypothetical protein